jgi:hypothetical protein
MILSPRFIAACMTPTGSVLLWTSSVFSFLSGNNRVAHTHLLSWIRIANWPEFVTSKTSCYLPKYKPRAIFMYLHKIFIYMILFIFLLNERRNAGDFPVSGKIGNTIFTIFICIFTIFSLN